MDWLSHYELVERLGQGRTGVVYKAVDARVGRLVAVKVLPPAATADPERRQRFVHDAKAASALGHPNVAALHEIGSEGAVDFVATEFVPGRTLAEIVPGGGLPVREALDYALQAVGALAAAHAAGVVHGDLKPSNLMVTGAGVVKVLDFGLSRLVERVIRPATGEVPPGGPPAGEVDGDGAYLSPEQVQGLDVDPRSDVFSFGAVLHEMLTGRRAFARPSRAATLSAVLSEEPEAVRRLSGRVPQGLDRIVHRCLRKDRAKRFSSMAEVKAALEEVRGKLDAGAGGAPRTRPGRRTGAAVAALCLVGVVAAMLWTARRSSERAAQPPVPITQLGGTVGTPSLSPDGRQVAFSWNGAGRDNVDVYVKPVGPGTPVRLTTNAAVDTSPAFSPDGRQIAFLRYPEPGRSLVVLVPVRGGPERVVAEGRLIRAGLTWSPDGRWLVVGERISVGVPSRLCKVSVETGEMRELTHPSPLYRAGDAVPSLSPDGKTLAFSRHFSGTRGELWLLDVTKDLEPAGEPFPLTAEKWDAGGNAWTASGRSIVFSVDKGFGNPVPGLRVVDVSPRGGAIRRLPGGDGGESPATSRTGSLVFVRTTRDENIWRLPLEGGRAGRPERLIASGRKDTEPRYSPDGKRIVFSSDRSGSTQVWICDADGSNAAELTRMDAGITSGARFSPDGRRIVFLSDFPGDMEILLATTDGGDPERLTTSPFHETAPSWSRDGSAIYFASNRDGGFQIWKTRPVPGSPFVRVTRNGGYAALESADGKTVYYAKGAATWSLWKVPSGGGPETLVLPSLANWGAFDVTATAIYYVASDGGSDRLRRLRLADGTDELLATLEKPHTFGIAAAPDDSAVLYAQLDRSSSDLMLVAGPE